MKLEAINTMNQGVGSKPRMQIFFIFFKHFSSYFCLLVNLRKVTVWQEKSYYKKYFPPSYFLKKPTNERRILINGNESAEIQP